MVNQNNYLDLWDVFANELVGDTMLFILLAIILVWYLSIKSKMPFQIPILLSILLLAIFFAQTNILIIWVFVVLVVGLMFYYAINKAMR